MPTRDDPAYGLSNSFHSQVSQAVPDATSIPGLRATAVQAFLALTAFAGFALLGGCDSAYSQGADAPPPQVVEVAEVTRREVIDWDSFTGRFEAVERVALRPRVSGYVERISFEEGALVEKEQVLFRIDARPYQARLNRARAELERAEAQYDLAGRELERARQLLRSSAISQEEHDQLVSNRSQAAANLEAARAAVESAALDVDFTRVVAPIAGRVSRAEITAGNYVTAGQSLLTTVVSVDPIHVVFEGNEQTYLRYAASGGGDGRLVRVGLADEQTFPHRGRLDFIDNALDPATGTIRARAVLDNPDGRFVPGLFARVQVRGGAPEASTLVAPRAIGTDQDRKYVYVVDDRDTVQYRRVELGELVDGLRVVKSGLQPGERVVTAGLARVQPGAVVTPQPAPQVRADASAGAPQYN
ncbi:MAG: efflux RND transporter periplasmic adaptor subunit [Algiphilus sp.]|nr:efflux RND transporter periplasmic adaptor subunit [Algiphilus sp.]